VSTTTRPSMAMATLRVLLWIMMIRPMVGLQSSLWQQRLPWIESVRASLPYWVFRSLDGCLLLAGFVVYGISFFTGERTATTVPSRVDSTISIQAPSEVRADHWIATAYGTTFGAGLLFFVVSFLALGVYPAIQLHETIVRTLLPMHKGL
jgi:cytochrome c oxidase cbb3-type subunit I/II